jgi:hypothetical protein
MGFLPQYGLEGRRATAAVAIVAALAGASSAANALEQPPQYPIGVGTVYDAFYSPVPGLTAFIYSLNMSDASLRNFYGEASPPNSSLAVNALALRILNVWDAQFLGARPITWGVVPVAYFNGTLDLQNAGLGVIHEGDWMLGDTGIGQGLSWHFGNNWSAQVSLEVYLPTGPYSTAVNHPFNFGSNMVTFYPNAGVTYWNHDTNDTFSYKLQYIVSTENPATHYQNGDSVEMEGGAGIGLGRFGLNKNLGLDVVGFALMQTEDDSGPGMAPGQKSQLFGLGPQIRYNFEHGGLAIKWEHEFDGKGICQGERVWAQTAFPLFGAEKPIEPPLK